MTFQALEPGKPYTFSKIFELKIPADELAQFFGYGLRKAKLNLPQYPEPLDRLQELRDCIEEVLPYVDLSNKTSRRKVLISARAGFEADYAGARKLPCA